MFQSFLWNETAARVFASREPVRVVVAENDTGAAIVPACLRGERVGLIGEGLFDYRDVLACEPNVLASAWGRVAEWGNEFELVAISEASCNRWEGFPIQPFAKAPGIARMGTTAEDFVRSQTRLGRHSRRLRKHGLEFHRHPGSNRALIKTIYGRKAEQPESLFSDPLRQDFMVEICSQPEAHCEVFTYQTGVEVVAAIVTFRDETVRRFYTIYFDQRWASLSPGQVLLFEVAAESLREGLDSDFMTGEYPYKMRLANQSVQLYRLCASPEQMQAAAQRSIPSNTIAA